MVLVGYNRIIRRKNLVIRFIILVQILIILTGCGGNHHADPVLPGAEPPVFDFETQAKVSNRIFWGYYEIHVDAGRTNCDIIPLRNAGGHWNILKWLEVAPCTDCLKITDMVPSGNGTILVGIEITHPFDDPKFTGFDVRGIPMFNASRSFPLWGLMMSDRTMGDGELVNAEGYTPLYNWTTEGLGWNGLKGYYHGQLATISKPTSLLNGFKYNISDDPGNTRSAFYAGDSVKVTYDIDMPDGPFVFGYAVDASWEPPIEEPVDDPITDFGPGANCPEPWKILVTEDSSPGGLTSQGGQTNIIIDVYDWQGYDPGMSIKLECTDLLPSLLHADMVEITGEFIRYKKTITNEFKSPPGQYSILVSSTPSEIGLGSEIMNFRAYQVIKVTVVPEGPLEITPQWINFEPDRIAVHGNSILVPDSFNGLHIFDVTDPLDPAWAGLMKTNGPVDDFDVYEDNALIVSREQGTWVQLWNVSDPYSPYSETVAECSI